MNGDPELRRSVRRTVGIAALRKIRRIVDAEQAREEGSRRWARRLSLVFVVAAALVLVWMLTA
ncbi:MAG: cytochrome d ubiquinol oxidase subunit II [Burkholderiaceae bacterium]|nr:cytochrome d ubiquinol oxidase subunit II [Sulfuritalea sp.]MCF8175076.1 cytochrome d ubiquinol oxidase subunit II [Burkholderiaceae bacterium]MCF8183751.1 cytochrome d ubiquinol oxidase subunit II [Polynucleobacter sp.]